MLKQLASVAALGAAAGAFAIAPQIAPHPLASKFCGRSFAHRGLFDSQIPENSLPAFALAVEAGYGIELDVQLTADGQVVVFHDDDLARMCGVPLRVRDCSWETLKTLPLLGTIHRAPLLWEVLTLVGGRVPLIVELKTTPHIQQSCMAVYGVLRDYVGDYCVESMNPLMMGWFRRNAPHILRGQLAQKFEGGSAPLGRAGALILSNLLLNGVSRPHFVAYRLDGADSLALRLCRQMGAFTVAWTVREKDYLRAVRGTGGIPFDSIIFEGFCPPPRLREGQNALRKTS